jgi:hypothetical protein
VIVPKSHLGCLDVNDNKTTRLKETLLFCIFEIEGRGVIVIVFNVLAIKDLHHLVSIT